LYVIDTGTWLFLIVCLLGVRIERM
jgi:hypothetical protein